MSRRNAHRVLRADAAWDAFVGAILVLAPLDAVGGTLDLPALFRSPAGPVLGVVSLVFAVLLWRVPSAGPVYSQAVNVLACWGNALVTVFLLLYSLGLGANLTFGSSMALGLAMVACASFAYLEDRIARSGVLEGPRSPA